MEVVPIQGLSLGLEVITTNDPDAEWEWAYVFSFFIVRFMIFKYR